MRSLSALAAILSLLAATGAQSQTAPSSAAKQPAKAPGAVTLAPAPGEEVMEDRWIALAEIPDDYFTRAKAHVAKDREVAAKDLRKAVAVLELRAEQAPGEAKAALTDAVQEVRQLERGLEQGTIRSAKQLAQPLARAEHALAHEHYLRAEQAWSSKEETRAGHELALTAHYTEAAARWSGSKAEQAVKASVRDTRRLADTLIAGSARAADAAKSDVGEGIAQAGKSVEQLAQWMSSPKEQGTGGSAPPEK